MLRGLSPSTFSTGGILPAPARPDLVFEPNRGQIRAQVSWIGRAGGYDLLLDSEGITLMFPECSSNVRIVVDGARSWNDWTGLEPTGGVTNYFPGSDVNGWCTGVPHFARVRAGEIYEGIDLVLQRSHCDAAFVFLTAPGADSSRIRLTFEGASVRVDGASGDWILTTTSGSEVRHIRPVVRSQAGAHLEIPGDWELHARDTLCAMQFTER